MFARIFVCLLPTALIACNTPSVPFLGQEAARVQIEGSTFDVYVSGERAEAIRINPERRPQIGVIARKAELAIEQASGCPVTRIHGDVALLAADIDCTKPIVAGQWARFAKPKRAYLECVQTGGRIGEDLEMSCF